MSQATRNRRNIRRLVLGMGLDATLEILSDAARAGAEMAEHIIAAGGHCDTSVADNVLRLARKAGL